MEVTLRASSHPEGRSSCALPAGAISPKYDIVPLFLDGLIVVVDEGFGREPLVVVVVVKSSANCGMASCSILRACALISTGPPPLRTSTLPTLAQLASGSSLHATGALAGEHPCSSLSLGLV